jgi:hypothetical protein
MISRVKLLHRRLLQVTHTVSPRAGRRCVEVETHVVPLSAIQRVTHKEHALQIYTPPTPLLCTYDTHETHASWRDFQTVVEALAGTPVGPVINVSPAPEEPVALKNVYEDEVDIPVFKTFG